VDSNTVVVTINVVGAPTAHTQSAPTVGDTTLSITLTGSDPNVPPLSLTYIITAEPAHGTLSGKAPNLTYTPADGYSGPDSFQFKVNNGTLDSDVAMVSITVMGEVAPTSDGPKLTSVKRYGYHLMPTTLVLAFDQPLVPASAENVKNYLITDPGGQRVAIARAFYNPARLTVALHPIQRISIHYAYGMIVMGQGSRGLRNIAGQLLDGADTGQPGSDYRVQLTWRQLVLGHVSIGFLIKYHIPFKHARPTIRSGHVAAPQRPSRTWTAVESGDSIPFVIV
jgi:hypothetical protein